jgi:hypothetical protein
MSVRRPPPCRRIFPLWTAPWGMSHRLAPTSRITFRGHSLPRAQPISDAEFAGQAATLKAQRIAVMDRPAQHLGIRRRQDIFRGDADRLYHGASDRQVPAENNLAGRDLRPTVISWKSASARPPLFPSP